jgi:hypothetical protein
MAWFVPLVIILPLLVFYFWMFRDMTSNSDLPSNSAGPLGWPPTSKLEWLWAFVLLNVLAASYYYFTEYKGRR